MKRLHFTLGPVQAFVAQSRRTRDLWASSWLLSWLSGHAMRAALADSGNSLELPALNNGEVAELLLRKHAALPNRFIARTEDGAAAGRAAAAAVCNAWGKVADAVWDQFVQPVAADGKGSDVIWKRQVGSFWEIVWAVGDTDDILERRKLWRCPPATVEPGDHCALMPQWQELSGHTCSRKGGEGRKRQRAFWQKVRTSPGVHELDVDPREQLCAIALIKRLFPKLHRATQERLFGFVHDAAAWPSTTDLAAEPWRQAVLSNSALRSSADDYAKKVHAASPFAGRVFEKLHGNYLIESALENPKGTPLQNDRDRPGLLDALRALCRGASSTPSPHYAIVLGDGDRIGAMLRDARHAGPQALDQFTHALVKFAGQVPKVVEQSGGYCVYAGGDDVLALSPVPQALGCAQQLERRFAEAFISHEHKPTLSMATLYVHYRSPFSDALAAAHHLLDDVAKDRTGRASLAVALHKHSGPAAEFSAPWNWWQESTNGRPRWQALPALLSRSREDTTEEIARAPEMTQSYLHKIDALVRRLHLSSKDSPDRRPHLGDFIELPDEIAKSLPELLTAELLVGRRLPDDPAKRTTFRKVARSLVEVLLDFSRLVHCGATPMHSEVNQETFSIAAPRLALFLSGGGMESV